jgi:hypothetical protein
MDHIWHPSLVMPTKYLLLQGFTSAMVRTDPMPDGRYRGKYLWQFRKTVGYADTVDQAKDYVEAGAEFFDTFRRNPYAG